MTIFDSMLQRNKDFAAQQSAGNTLMPSLPRALPNVKRSSLVVPICVWIPLTYSESNLERLS